MVKMVTHKRKGSLNVISAPKGAKFFICPAPPFSPFLRLPHPPFLIHTPRTKAGPWLLRDCVMNHPKPI